MPKRKAPETENERRRRVSRLEREMDRWLAHMQAELKKRRERERAAELERQMNP
jgi:hypothetical protein